MRRRAVGNGYGCVLAVFRSQAFAALAQSGRRCWTKAETSLSAPNISCPSCHFSTLLAAITDTVSGTRETRHANGSITKPMELQPRSQPRSRPLNRSVDEQPNETSHGTGGNGTRCLVGLDVLLPGRPQPQPVELYFDAEWAATADPVSVHFENSSGVTINSEQAAAWEDDNLLAVQLEPIDIKHLHLAGRKADTRSRRNFIPFQAVAMALLAITLTALYTRYSNASPGDGPKTQQPCVISLHEILNNATSSYVDAAVLMTKPVTSPGGSRGLVRRTRLGLSPLSGRLEGTSL